MTPPTPARACTVIIGPAGHGAVRHAELVARAMGIATIRHREAPDRIEIDDADTVHLHFTEALFGPTTEAAADRFHRLVSPIAARLVVTFHDLPDTDGSPRSARRRATYRGVADLAHETIVSSEHERCRLFATGATTSTTVIPLPVIDRPLCPIATPIRTVGVLGYLYPGKGHDLLIDHIHDLPADIAIVAGGSAAPGHDELPDELAARAARRGRPFVVTGPLDDAGLERFVASVTVPVVPAPQTSASMSLATWIGAGRRPLVVANRATVEFAAGAPGLIDLASPAALPAALRLRLGDPTRTWRRDPPPPHLRPGAVADAHWKVLQP